MTLFEFLVSMIITGISIIGATVNDKWYFRAIFAVLILLMSYFAGSMGGHLK